MKIDHLDVINLRHRYPDGAGFRGAGGQCNARVTSLVLVHTDGPHIGIGSAYSHPGLVQLIVKQQLEPMILGRDATEVQALWDLMYGLTRWYGRKGAAVSALGGIDTALWDLRGKAAGKPLYALWGGERVSCPAYASGLPWGDVDELVTQAKQHIANGFRRMKMRLGCSEAYDVEAVTKVRAAIGPDIDLMVDASMRYTLDIARRMGKFLAGHNAFWFEEPFAPEQVELYAELRGTVDVPIAAGENEFGVQGFDELIRCGAVDIVQPDASRCGGISEVRRVAERAAKAGLKVAPHTWSDAVALVANAHVVAAIDNGLTVEMDRTGNPFIDDLLRAPLRVVDGEMQLGEAPGLGIELDHGVIDQYRMEDPLHMPDGHYSDMIFGPQHLDPVGPYEEI
ncbi:MAG: mandelate racemase/muconate lactonizing enzyme family protein [Lentisphaeria bacterium]|jgi:D-galactarolactone cycloisomerase|nr:mandelate racemase/muconate lactonizing enzyme family protein [Lentisphaeria bacterium]